MRVAIHQPNFLPRPKVLQKLSNCDLWIILDNVQYVKQEWQNRAKIVSFGSDDIDVWLTLPVRLCSGSKTRISEVKVVEWEKNLARCLNIIKGRFYGAPHSQEITKFFEEFQSIAASDLLCDLNVISTKIALEHLGKVPRMVFASELASEGKKSALVASLCKSVGALEYIADSGARNYLNLADFSGIRVLWQEWDQQAVEIGLSEWRDTSFMNLYARFGKQFMRNHLGSINLSN